MGSQLLALGMTLIGAIALAVYGMRYQRKARTLQEGVEETDVPPLEATKHVQPVFRAFTDEVGRVAEEGAAIHVALGSGGFLNEQGMVSVAALQGIQGLNELSAAYDTPPLVTTGDATLYVLADHQLRSAYAQVGSARQYRPNLVRFMAPSPFLYAAMSATLAFDEPVGTNINLGAFDQEVTLLTDAAARRDVKVFGGAASALGLAALYPAVPDDRLIVGEELFAGGAEVTGRSAFWASLSAENVLRWLVVIGIVVAVGVSLFSALIGSGG